MKFILLLILCSLGAVTAQAQAHNPGPNSNCLLNKNVWLNSEKMVCPACEKKKEKETEAKAAEDKRRFDVLVAKEKAEKEARDKAWQDKLAEDAKKAKSAEEVLIMLPENTRKAEVAKIAKEVTNTTIMIAHKGSYSYSPHYFYNEKNEQILHNSEWSKVNSINERSFSDSCVNNLGIVRVGDPKGHGLYPFHFELIDSKGNSILKDNNIMDIYHMNNGWFLVGGFDHTNYYLYNIDTKKKVILNNLIPAKSLDTKYTVLLKYYPILSNNDIATNTFGGSFNDLIYSQSVKGQLIKWRPAQLSEELISKYSFVLVHMTRQGYETFATEYNAFHFDYHDSVVLFCVSKEGTITEIILK